MKLKKSITWITILLLPDSVNKYESWIFNFWSESILCTGMTPLLTHSLSHRLGHWSTFLFYFDLKLNETQNCIGFTFKVLHQIVSSYIKKRLLLCYIITFFLFFCSSVFLLIFIICLFLSLKNICQTNMDKNTLSSRDCYWCRGNMLRSESLPSIKTASTHF